MYLVFFKSGDDTSCCMVEGMHCEFVYNVDKVEVINIEKNGEGKLVFDSEDSLSDS